MRIEAENLPPFHRGNSLPVTQVELTLTHGAHVLTARCIRCLPLLGMRLWWTRRKLIKYALLLLRQENDVLIGANGTYLEQPSLPKEAP